MSRIPAQDVRNAPFLGRGNVRSINTAIDRINDFSQLGGVSGGIAINRGPMGTTAIDVSPTTRDDSFYGVLVSSGPQGQGDYTDARYWVRQITFCQTQGALNTDPVAAYLSASYLTTEGTVMGGSWLTATNFLECQGASHSLTTIPTGMTSGTGTVLPAYAIIVKVSRFSAQKFTTIPVTDFANMVWVFEPVTSTSSNIGASVFVNITGYAGVGPTSWNPYIATFPDGISRSVYQREDITGIQGTPGSLGVNVAADGSIGSCHIQPAGLGKRRVDWDVDLAKWVFEFQNGSQ